MGSLYQKGACWIIRFREGGKRRTERFEDRDVAERVLARISAGLSREEVGLKPDDRDVPTLAVLMAAWLERRKETHPASIADDRSRWKLHNGPFFGGYKPSGVTKALIRRFVELKLATNLSSTTVGHCVRQLSTFFTDLVEQGHAADNPVHKLPRATRRLIRAAHDPKDTPFLESKADVRRVFLALPEPYNVMFAVGALAGLRTGEVLGLSWADVNLGTHRIHIKRQVQDGRLRQLKDKESRIVPLLDGLFPILQAWHLRTGGAGPLFRPKYLRRGGRPELGRPPEFIRPHTLNYQLAKALAACGLQGPPDEQAPGEPVDRREKKTPRLNAYRCMRHTYASHWVMDGRPMEKLRTILGHEDLTTTMRYAHLVPGAFTAADLAAVGFDFSPAVDGKVIPLAPTGQSDKLGTVGHGDGLDAAAAEKKAS
jgi:integrase